MEMKKCVTNRYSCRSFRKEDVDDNLILEILEMGITAPSAKNRQPWRFAIAKGETKDKIVSFMKEKISKETFEELKNYERKVWNTASSVKNSMRVISEAPVLILIFKETNEPWAIADNLSIGGCIENMCLCATDLGLSSLCIRDVYSIEKEVCDMMKGKNLELVSSLAIGYPKRRRNFSWRRKFRDNFVYFKRPKYNDFQKSIINLKK